jgi:hypothetical protein
MKTVQLYMRPALHTSETAKERQMKIMKLVFGFTAGLCLLGQGLAAELLAAEGSQTNLTVELLIFSGRPNPTWQLQDTNQLRRLRANLKELPTAFEKEPAEWSRLGFAGFRIRGGEAMGLPAEIRIYQGVIMTGRGKEAKYLKDTQGLERRLLAEARSQTLPPPVKVAIENYENARRTQ